MGNLKVGDATTIPFGGTSPVNPAGSCPAHPAGPIPDDQLLVDIAQSTGTGPDGGPSIPILSLGPSR